MAVEITSRSELMARLASQCCQRSGTYEGMAEIVAYTRVSSVRLPEELDVDIMVQCD
jgi:hypothetical protein